MDRKADGQKYERSQQQRNNMRHVEHSNTTTDTPIGGRDRPPMDVNPEDDPGDSSDDNEPESGSEPDSEDDNRQRRGESWLGTKWTPLVEDDNNETSMVTTNKKPKVPTPPRMNADHTWSTADKFDNWVLEVLDYLVIYKVDPEKGREVIAYTSEYLEGVAK